MKLNENRLLQLAGILSETSVNKSSIESALSVDYDKKIKDTEAEHDKKIKEFKAVLQDMKDRQKVQSSEISELVKMINDFGKKWTNIKISIITKKYFVEFRFDDQNTITLSNKEELREYYSSLRKIASFVKSSKCMIIGSDKEQFRGYGERSSPVEVDGDIATIRVYTKK